MSPTWRDVLGLTKIPGYHLAVRRSGYNNVPFLVVHWESPAPQTGHWSYKIIKD